MKAKLRGTEIYFDIAGMQLAFKGKKLEERPVIFMLHGGPGGDHLRFKQHSLELQEVAQLVFIDHRGCGRSKKSSNASNYSLKNNIEDIEALRKHLGLEKISVLGTSYGGMVAQGYATTYPNRLEKLILVATSPSYHFKEEAVAYLDKHATPVQIKMAEKLWEGKFKNHQEIMAYFKVMEPLYSVTSKTTGKKHTPSHTVWSIDALNQGFGHELRRFNFIPRLNKIKCPTLILAGKEDWICRPSQAKIMKEHIPHATLKIFNHCGHAIAVDAHKAYIRIIKQFLHANK